ncbi:prefoldin subunit alpha [Candidatus Woesearchaeota archaeon]|nr:prefoldin subunit alpha [Candidatus Woesearchaeota archaeon]
MTMDQGLQEKYMEMQVLQNQIKQVERQLEVFETQLADLTKTMEALDQLGVVEEGDQIKVPLTNGIFVDATIGRTDRLTVNVGSDTLVSRTVPETKSILDEQVQEISKYRDELIQGLQKLVHHAQRVEDDLRALAAKE